MKKFVRPVAQSLMVLTASAMLFTSCGKKSASVEDDAEIAQIESAVTENTSNGARNSSHVDSLALMADDLTPVEAAQVLATYMQIAADARERDDSKTRLETMRKFVDVYDIVVSVNGSEMHAMFDRLARHSPNFNIEQTVSDYRSELSDYASGSAVEDGSDAEPQRPDTSAVKIDTLTTAADDPIID